MATQEDIARHLDLSDRSIRDLQKMPGAPVKRGRGEYDLDEWRLFYIRVLRSQRGAAGAADEPEAGDDDAEVRELKLREQRLKVEAREESIAAMRAKRVVFERTYAPVDLITHAVESVASALSARLEALIPKIKMACPDLSVEAIGVLQKEVAAASNELASIQPDFDDYDRGGEESSGEGVVDSEEKNAADWG